MLLLAGFDESTMERKAFLQIKGLKEGLLISLGEGGWPEKKQVLLDHIQDNTSFFQGARVTLDVGNEILHASELGALRDQLSEAGVSLWAVLSQSPLTEKTARDLGLATRLPAARVDTASAEKRQNENGERALFIKKTLRSGTRVVHQGSIVILGDINPGAEVIAAGSVIVWGRLKGVVHAGAEGDEGCVVCALEMMPMQLRIASHIALHPGRKGKPQPEIARICEQQVVADPWDFR